MLLQTGQPLKFIPQPKKPPPPLLLLTASNDTICLKFWKKCNSFEEDRTVVLLLTASQNPVSLMLPSDLDPIFNDIFSVVETKNIFSVSLFTLRCLSHPCQCWFLSFFEFYFQIAWIEDQAPHLVGPDLDPSCLKTPTHHQQLYGQNWSFCVSVN